MKKMQKKNNFNFTSFDQPTRLITCANQCVMQKGLSSGLPERTKQKTMAATAAMKIQTKSSNEADGAEGSVDNDDQESVGPEAGGSVDMDAAGVRTWGNTRNGAGNCAGDGVGVCKGDLIEGSAIRLWCSVRDCIGS